MSLFPPNTHRLPAEHFAPKGEGLSALVLIAGLVVGVSAERKAAALREYSLGGALGVAVGDMGTGSSHRYIEAARRKVAASDSENRPVLITDSPPEGACISLPPRPSPSHLCTERR